MGPWGGERRKEDRCWGRLKAMKPKLYSLHGLDSNHPWSHFTGIDFEKFSHNRIRKVDHYLVYVPGRLPLTNSSSLEFIPNLLLAYRGGAYTQAVAIPFHLAPLRLSPNLNLCGSALFTAAAVLYPELMRNWKIGCFLIPHPRLGSTILKFHWNFMGKCYIYSHSIWWSCY